MALLLLLALAYLFVGAMIALNLAYDALQEGSSVTVRTVLLTIVGWPHYLWGFWR